MRIQKLVLLASLAGAASLASASAAVTQYSVQGAISSSSSSPWSMGTPVILTFDYDPAAAGAPFTDFGSGATFISGISNVRYSFGGESLSAVLTYFTVQSAGADYLFYGEMGGFSGGSGGYSVNYFSFNMNALHAPVAANQAPTSLDLPWYAGNFTIDGSGSEGGFVAMGTFDPGSFTAVPEPSAAMLLGAAGSTVLLRRRRSRCR